MVLENMESNGNIFNSYTKYYSIAQKVYNIFSVFFKYSNFLYVVQLVEIYKKNSGLHLTVNVM